MLEDGGEGDDVNDVVDDDEDNDGEGSRDQLQRRLLGGADWHQENEVRRVSLIPLEFLPIFMILHREAPFFKCIALAWMVLCTFLSISKRVISCFRGGGGSE